ncbi:uncharacterized protein A4U43_C02F10140 [Asparagus officinalis]|uniref:Uncharacterized protein n=1 Tax=Asparagus officinalis TaxID=4686 RepID=A0A5P1FLB8_ASPOF|nr:uncharacterized protein A4U43_C02F10140 [Asparagus officinalis]
MNATFPSPSSSSSSPSTALALTPTASLWPSSPPCLLDPTLLPLLLSTPTPTPALARHSPRPIIHGFSSPALVAIAVSSKIPLRPTSSELGSPLFPSAASTSTATASRLRPTAIQRHLPPPLFLYDKNHRGDPAEICTARIRNSTCRELALSGPIPPELRNAAAAAAGLAENELLPARSRPGIWPEIAELGPCCTSPPTNLSGRCADIGDLILCPVPWNLSHNHLLGGSELPLKQLAASVSLDLSL